MGAPSACEALDRIGIELMAQMEIVERYRLNVLA